MTWHRIVSLFYKLLFLDLSESSEIKPLLKESSEQCLKVRENLAKKVFLSDSSNDLEILLTLDIEKLFDKYEELSSPKNSVAMKIEQILPH